MNYDLIDKLNKAADRTIAEAEAEFANDGQLYDAGGNPGRFKGKTHQ